MANMIGAFFGKGQDSRSIFSGLLIGEEKEIMAHVNQYNVIYISLNEMPRVCKSYEQYIRRIETRLIGDLQEAYPDCRISEEDAVWDAFTQVQRLFWIYGSRSQRIVPKIQGKNCSAKEC